MPDEDIGAAQMVMIARARRYLRKAEADGIDVGMSGLCYLNSWTPVPGYGLLQRWRKGWSYLGRFVYIIAKDLVAIARQPHYVVANGAGGGGPYTQVVVSWTRKIDFQPDGSFQDRYFNTNSREVPEALWFLISLDGAAPERLDSNIRVFRAPDGAPKYDLLFLVKTAFRTFLEYRRVPRKIPHTLSSASLLARQVSREVGRELRQGGYTSVVVPYEAQPFQHAVFRAAKDVAEEIRTIGYLHSALPPLPTDLLYRHGAPDVLLVHGRGQVATLQTQLDWPGERVRTIPSLRYRRDHAASFAGFIFFPYSFFDPDLLVSEFTAFLRAAAPAGLRPLQVRNHPNMVRSRRHLELERRFEVVLGEYADRFSPAAHDGDLSVFIGATASILEALERGVSVVHICSDPLFESHSEVLWPYLKVEQLSGHVFRYSLRDAGSCIELGSEPDMFRKYLVH